ncbi:MAG: outer membrane beta-barrel protein [Methylocystis sp.]
MTAKFHMALFMTAALIGGPAIAADLPSRKTPAPIPVPPPLWTGFYAGLNAGYGWGGTTSATTGALPIVDNIANDPGWGTPLGFTAAALSGVANVNQSGFIGGGQIGYNYQWSPLFVVGLEADIQGAAISGRGGNSGVARFGPDLSGFIDTAIGSSNVVAGVDWLGTVRGRLGYLVTPTLLAYGTGGLAYGGARAIASHALGFTDDVPTVHPTFGGVGRYSDIRVGWTAGGGLEWMFMPNWSLKAEALYYDLGAASFASSPVGALFSNGSNIIFANLPTTRVRFDGVMARAGVNYHLNWGANAAAAPPAPPPTWNDFYAGLNAGYGWGATTNVTTAAIPVLDNIAAAWGTPPGFTALASSGVTSVNQSGYVGGGQFGFNYRWSPAIVAGFETDIQGAAIRGSAGGVGFAQFGPDLFAANDTAFGAHVVVAGVDWIGTARSRLGYLVMPTLLAYGTGGLAYGGVRATAVHSLGFVDDNLTTIYPTLGGAGRYSDIRVGWTAGGGLEWAFTPNWTLKAEALYYDLGSASFASSPVGAMDPDGTNGGGFAGAPLFANSPVTRVRYDGVIARAGLNYHFTWGETPIVAKF